MAVTLCPECVQPVSECEGCGLLCHVGARHLRVRDCLWALRRAESRLRRRIVGSWAAGESAPGAVLDAYDEVTERIEALEALA